ncbi:MAG: methylmalonyl-CoA mutase family protein [Fulvivirga sp.]
MKQKLFEDFNKVDKKQWLEKATADLKGANPQEKYGWKIEDGISLDLYYDKSDTKRLSTSFQNRQYVADHPSGHIRHWDNLQEVLVDDDKKANNVALEALEGGAEGLIFKLQNQDVDYNVLLKDIQTAFCSVWFDVTYGKSTEATIKCLENLKPQTGGLIIDDIHAIPNIQSHLPKHTQLKIALTLSITDKSLSEKIAAFLELAIACVEHNDHGILESLSFQYPLGTDFFGEIAAMRALRQLYFQIIKAYKIEGYLPEDLHLIGVSTAWSNEDYNPHANMLKSTTAGMAAVLGGCDSLIVEPENNEKPYMTRVARNVSNILKEESYFNSNADPVAGSYYLESLTDTLAKEAWSLFQQKIDK